MNITESTIEEAQQEWSEGLAYTVLHGQAIAASGSVAQRESYGEVLPVQRVRAALAKRNQIFPAEALDDTFRKVTNVAWHVILFS